MEDLTSSNHRSKVRSSVDNIKVVTTFDETYLGQEKPKKRLTHDEELNDMLPVEFFDRAKFKEAVKEKQQSTQKEDSTV